MRETRLTRASHRREMLRKKNGTAPPAPAPDLTALFAVRLKLTTARDVCRAASQDWAKQKAGNYHAGRLMTRAYIDNRVEYAEGRASSYEEALRWLDEALGVTGPAGPEEVR